MPTHVLEEVTGNGENSRNLGGFWVLTGLSLFKTSAYSYLGFLPCVTIIIIILSFFFIVNKDQNDLLFLPAPILILNVFCLQKVSYNHVYVLVIFKKLSFILLT